MKKLLYALLLISGMACSQIQIIHFNAGWNSANDVPWFEELTDGKLKWIDIATDAKSQSEYKISVVPTILILVDGEEEERYQADISFSMQATKEEIQEAINEILMDQF
mgnify:FL=1|tara:strand:+ start:174 stop:497 length:324 start_codon:yes stop_codon:yes gene_type:complete